MHGSHNIYGRLLLPQLLPVAHRVLYLDSDIVVGADLNELANVDLQGYALAAVSHTSFRWSLESELCAELNFDLDAPNFNTGVILLDAKKWRANKLTEICLEFAHNNTKRLWGDQTVLNCVFYKSFKILDPRWNRILRGHEPAISVLQNTIYHFVGVPKPFDVLGDRLHSNYNLFRFFLDQTALKDWRPTSVSNLIQLKRNFLMGPAICRKIWRRFLRRKK
jgi:lipopolysaccharide biosynthesis glycosyltransferase